MSTRAVPYRRAAVVVALLLVVLVAWWSVRAGSEAAAPTAARAAGAAQAGRVAFDALPGSVAATLPLRSFSAGGVNATSPVGGGGGSGKFIADEPALVVDAADVDPLLLRAVTTGVHLKSVTVTLFHSGTSARQEVWRFDDVTITALRTLQSGSAKAPRVSLGLGYRTVTVTSYGANGTVAGSYCFDLAAVAGC